jgi:hypothetical protein
MKKYRPRREADENQKRGLAESRGREAFALLMEQRTRKTKIVLDDFGELELAGKVHDLLIIAPGGAYKTWWNDDPEKPGAIQLDFSEDLFARADCLVWHPIDSKTYERRVENFLATRDRPRVLIMNVEALSLPGRARTTALDFLGGDRARRTYVAIDESTRIKNWSKRTRFVIDQIRPRANYRRILSGLVAPRSPLDLFYQFYFLDRRIIGHDTYVAFRAEVAYLRMEWWGGGRLQKVRVGDGWQTKKVPTIVIDRQQGRNGFNMEAVDRVLERTKKYTFRVRFTPKEPTTYEIREVEMTPEQRRAYSDLKDQAITFLASRTTVSATVVVAQLLKMHQVLLGHVVDDVGNEQTFPERRTTALVELLEDYGGKAIVWCPYDHDVRKVADALEARVGTDPDPATDDPELGNKALLGRPEGRGGRAMAPGGRGARQRQDDGQIPAPGRGSGGGKNGVPPGVRVAARFWGGNTRTREAEETLFKTDPACRFMVATPDAGGMGRTWDGADLAVFYGNRDNLEHRDQAERRTLDRDKPRGVMNVDFICPGTVEEKILWALRNKLDVASIINGDNWREWVI